MYKTIFLIISIFFANNSFAEDPYIDIVYPLNNQNIQVTDKTFILGNVFPKNAALTINGNKVPVYRTGGFLAYLPISPGEFIFSCELTADDGKTAKKDLNVRVLSPRKITTTSTSKIEKQDYLPNKNIGVGLGEEVLFQCKTLPKKHVVCKVDKSNGNSFPLQEFTKNGAMGFYRTTQAFHNPFKTSSFTFEVTDDPKVPKFEPPVKITVLPPSEYPVLEVIKDGAKARFSPGKGYDTFLKKGTRLKSTGFSGKYYKGALTKNRNVYVNKNEAKELDKSSIVPLLTLGNIYCYEDNKALYIKCSNLSNVNATWVEYENEEKLSLKFYQTVANVDRIDFGKSASLKDIKWAQLEDNLLQLDIYLNFEPFWGYFVEFKNNQTIITIKKTLRNISHSDITICLDPGHGNKDKGARGPTGVSEIDVNYSLAKTLGEKLKAKGFKVIYTRKNKNGLSLYERAPFAHENNADIFISLHHNAPGDGVDPYKVRSTETYFYNRSGKKLGEFIHPKLVMATGLKDAGLKYGNLAVCRNNAMPSLLLEVDYIIIPEAEERIQNEEFQQTVAESILVGVKEFIAL